MPTARINMLHLKPSVTSISASELEDLLYRNSQSATTTLGDADEDGSSRPQRRDVVALPFHLASNIRREPFKPPPQEDVRDAPSSTMPPVEAHGQVDGEIEIASLEREPDQMPGALGTPARPSRLSIYNDSLPSQTQPRTPLNLPESRHQSRLVGPSTAPLRRHDASSGRRDGWQSVRTRRRDISPMGIRDPGFEGLYGGSENVEDSQHH
jgi:hypothetical protein